jgi:hypothetical protein
VQILDAGAADGGEDLAGEAVGEILKSVAQGAHGAASCRSDGPSVK